MEKLEEQDEEDPIMGLVEKISDELKQQIEMIAQEIWKEERPNVYEHIAKLLNITTVQLEEQLLQVQDKKRGGKPRVANK
jgi:hypothetical protein